MSVFFNGDGRTDRASLLRATRLAVRQRTLDRASLQPLHVSPFDNGRSTERPYNRYTFRFDGTDALPLDTSRASLHVLLEEVFEIVPAIKVGCFAE